jgi:hypothetical protein
MSKRNKDGSPRSKHQIKTDKRKTTEAMWTKNILTFKKIEMLKNVVSKELYEEMKRELRLHYDKKKSEREKTDT